MRTVFLYIVLTLAAYLCQTVLYPVWLPPGLRVDLCLILVVYASFTHGVRWTLGLALVLGVLMDIGLPLRGSFHPLIYLGITLLGSLLWHNLNLHSKRYQAVFFGLCALVEGGGVWALLWLVGMKFAEPGLMLQTLAGRTVATGLLGPLLLSALGRLHQWLGSLGGLEQCQEG
jgi:cell shape-determining protein MreD